MTSTSPDGGHAAAQGNAHLLDGVTGADHRVAILVEARGLRILTADPRAAGPQCPLFWPWEETYRPASAGDDQVFAMMGAQDARLTPDTADLARAILRQARGNEREAGHQISGFRRRPTAAMAIGATLAAVVVLLLVLAPLSNLAAHLLPADTGAATADQVISGLAESHGACVQADGMAALDDLTRRLALAADLDAPLVTVIGWDMVNAFALPGGRIILTSGLLHQSRDASEIAAVLAHEIAHVVHRDPMTGWIRQEGVSLVLALVLGQEAGGSIVSAITGGLLNASYTRDQEARADQTALDILRAADIRADGGVAFFKRLSEREADGTLRSVLGLLSTHPGSAERAELFAGAETGSGPGLDEDALAALKRICSVTRMP